MKLFTLFIFLSISFNVLSKTNIVIHGYVEDLQSGERLVGASIFCSDLSIGTTTNNYGFFSLSIPKDEQTIEISYIGYKSLINTINIHSDTSVVFKLEKSAQEIDAVTVLGRKGIRSVDLINQASLSPQQIEKVPVILGETDILKAFQLMPGVQSGIEGTSGMVVRGSDPGQNLILLDGVPVYNVNHLFGLFSVFNNDAIKSTTLIKGAFPARYGGRVASVLDIRMKEGNSKKFNGAASIGLISSKLFLEGPITKDKTSFMLSLRRSYLDLLMNAYFKWIQEENSPFSYNFYDINFKLNHIINDRNRIYISYYNGGDKYKSSDDNSVESATQKNEFHQKQNFGWGNNTGTLRWNYQISKSIFSNTTLVYSNYQFNTHNFSEMIKTGGIEEHSIYETNFLSGIKDIGINLDIDYRLNNMNNIKLGTSYTQHEFKPGVNVYDFSDFLGVLTIDSVDNTLLFSNTEFNLYAEDNLLVSDNIEMQLGARLAIYNSKEKVYSSLEPRLSFRWMTNNKNAFDFAYAKTSQAIHLLTNSSVGFPTDQWVPVTENINPITAHQFNISYLYNIRNGFSLSSCLFYKKMFNVLEYKEGANKKLNWQEIVVQGEGTAKGLEIMLKKEFGTTTGWLAYTLSKSDRTFEEINNGKTFPYKYDRRHDLKIVLMHQFNSKVDISANWIFNTGYAVTLPLELYSRVIYEPWLNSYSYSADILSYDHKNNFRMPNYHRLDVAVNFHKKRKLFKRTLSLGIYNVYMNHNALFYDFYDGKLRSISVLPIVPSINYIIKF